MQQPNAACARTQSLTIPCPCATCIWLLHPAPTSAQMVLTLCNLRWWCVSCHQMAQRPHWYLQWTLSTTCAGGVFLVPFSALSKVHT